MYTILVNDDNTLTTSVRENIMHRTSMVDKLHFLVNPDYKGYDMSTFTCLLEYVLPVSETYVPEVLTLSPELYKEKLEFVLPIDTRLTAEEGNISLKLTFTCLEMTPEGEFVERVRKTESTTLTIIPVEKWNDYIPDAKMDNIVQIINSIKALQEQQNAQAEMVASTKLEDVVLDKETNEVYGVANGQKVGTGFSIIDLGDEIAEETEVVRVVI